MRMLALFSSYRLLLKHPQKMLLAFMKKKAPERAPFELLRRGFSCLLTASVLPHFQIGILDNLRGGHAIAPDQLGKFFR
jgi:hypothetical protein